MTHEQTIYAFFEPVVVLLAYIFVIRFIRRPLWMIVTLIISCLVIAPFLLSLFSFPFYFWFNIYLITAYNHYITIAFISLRNLAFGLSGAVVACTIAIRSKYPRSILACGFIVLYGLIAIYEIAGIKIHTQPPSQACLQSELYFSLGEAKISIPANPAMMLDTGPSSGWPKYLSKIDFAMKELCHRAGENTKPMKIVNFRIAFPLIDDSLKDRSFQFSRLMCDGTDNIHNDFLCEAATFKPSFKRRLWSVEIFLPEKFITSATGPWRYRYESFLEAKEAAAKAGTPWTAASVGLFDLYPEGYYVARDATLTDGGKNPITVHCNISTTMGWLNCTTVTALPDGLQSLVSFSTPVGELNQTAIAANQSAAKLLTLLSTP